MNMIHYFFLTGTALNAKMQIVAGYSIPPPISTSTYTAYGTAVLLIAETNASVEGYYSQYK